MAAVRMRQWLRGTLRGLLWTALLLTALVASARLHLNHPQVRRGLAHLLEQELNRTLEGRVELGPIEELSLGYVRVSSARLFDVQMREVIALETVHVDLDAWPNLERHWRDALAPVVIPHVRADRAQVRLFEGDDAIPTLAFALTPRPSTSNRARAPSSPLRLYLPSIELGTVDVLESDAAYGKLEPHLSRVHGRVLSTPKGVYVEVEDFAVRLSVSAPSLNLPQPLHISGTGSLAVRVPGAINASFNGFAGPVEVDASAQWLDDNLDAWVRLPELSPDAAKRWLPAWPLKEALSTTVHAVGPLSALNARAQLESGGSALSIAGRVELTPRLRFSADLVLDETNLAQLIAHAPPTSLRGHAHLTFLNESGVRASLDATTLPGWIAETPLPGLRAQLDYIGGELEGSVSIDEPASPATVSLRIQPGTQYQAETSLQRVNLATHPRLPRGARGTTTVQLQAQIQGDTLRARAHGDVQNFAYASLRANTLHFDVTAHAPTTDIRAFTFSGHLSADRLSLADVVLGTVNAKALGTSNRIAWDATARDPVGRQATFSSIFDVPTGTLRNGHLTATHGDIKISASVVEFAPELPRLHVEDITIVGAGNPLRARLLYRPGVLELQADSDGLRLERLAHALGLGAMGIRGTIGLQADVNVGPDVERSRVLFELQKGAYAQYGRLSARAEAELRDGHVHGRLWGADETTNVGFGMEYALTLAGSPLELTSWVHATGSGEVSASNLQLPLLNPVLAQQGLVVSGVAGLRARLSRENPEQLPTVHAEIGAQGLSLEHSATGRHLDESTLYLTALYKPEDHLTLGSGSLRDPGGDLATVTYRLNYDPSVLMTGALSAFRALRDAPLELTVRVPPRPISSLPLILQTAAPEGTLSVNALLQGSLEAPSIQLSVDALDLRPPGAGPRYEPIAARGTASYDLNSGSAQGELVAAASGRQVATLSSKLQLPRGRIPSSLGEVEGNLQAELDALPLALLPGAPAELSGAASGTITVSAVDGGTLTSALQLHDLRVGDAALGSGSLSISGKPNLASAELTLCDGARLLKLSGSAHSEHNSVPLWTEVGTAEGTLELRSVDPGIFGPALTGTAERLSGNLDAVGGLRLESHSGRYQVSGYGQATLTDASAFIPLLGLELRDINAVVEAVPARTGMAIVIEDVRARARSQRDNLHASARLSVQGASLTGGSARISLDAVPLTLEGVSLGRATGEARVALARRTHWPLQDAHAGEDFLEANVTLSRLRFRAAETAGRDLISLDEPAHIVVLQQLEAQPKATAHPMRLVVDLNDDVRLAFGQIDLPLGGQVTLLQADTQTLLGTIRLKSGGRIPLFGQRLDVQEGKITLNPEEPDNPALYVLLVGHPVDGPDVNVTVSGTLKEPVMTPPPEQLQALLGSASATAISGGVQALGVTRLLGPSLGSLQVSVEPAEKEDQQARYGASFAITDNLWFQGTFQRGQDADINQASPDVFSGTLDYRFRKNWSLKTEVRNTGGSVDVQWRHRY